MAPSSALSKTLQSITLTKIRELQKLQKSYEARKKTLLDEADKGKSRLEKLQLLLKATKELYPGASADSSIANIERWLDQARYDPSIPTDMLDGFETELRGKLEIQSRKLVYADLYSRLLTEWMNPPTTTEDAQMEDDFEVVEKQKERLKQLCDQFESVVFDAKQTDIKAIGQYIDKLFESDDSRNALVSFRGSVAEIVEEMMNERFPFTERSLKDCLEGLLTQDLLSDEKRGIIQEFLQNSVIMAEICDVLNMRFKDIKNWDWHAPEEGIMVMPRQQLNGKYRIWMDEDVLQMILVQYIGIRLCNILKSLLKDLIRKEYVWDWGSGKFEERDWDRQYYYLGNYLQEIRQNVQTKRKYDFQQVFFFSLLPETETTLQEKGGAGYDEDAENEEKPQPKKPKGGTSTKQQLLRKIATETLLAREFDGEVAVLQSDIKWYATALPHSTIYAVMRFFGFPPDLLSFFKRYLEAPLSMDQASDDRVPQGPRKRLRGVPMAHGAEKFIGELVLFVLDLAVNKETGLFLYRLHDDLWLCGNPKKVAAAWDVMQKFANVMGIEYNLHKTGSVYIAKEGVTKNSDVVAKLPKGEVSIGFLSMDPSNGEWKINETAYEAHVKQLQRQLNACDSVLSWVQTWNSCIGRFFSYTFGEPAHCFGRRHVDAILETHEKMQRTLFGTSTVTDHLKSMISSRFKVSDIPNSFLFLPEQLGGLGLRNPFISLFLVRDEFDRTPTKIVRDFLKDEKRKHKNEKKEFENLKAKERASRLQYVTTVHGDSDLSIPPSERDEFISFEEFIKHIFRTSDSLLQTYNKLLSTGVPKSITTSHDVDHAITSLIEQGQISERLLDDERKWVLMMYKDELFELFGGLSLVEKEFLPTGVLAMGKKKVAWQMVL
jgi:hypothetical protein